MCHQALDVLIVEHVDGLRRIPKQLDPMMFARVAFFVEPSQEGVDGTDAEVDPTRRQAALAQGDDEIVQARLGDFRGQFAEGVAVGANGVGSPLPKTRAVLNELFDERRKIRLSHD